MLKSAANMKPYLIGVAGGTGSGKTTVVEKLSQKFSPDVLCLAHDSYYRDLSKFPIEQREKENFDHPDALETGLLVDNLKSLLKGEEVSGPVYDFGKHIRRAETVDLVPKKLIVVEGILIFDSKELRELFDYKVFVDTEADVRFIRRLMRDIKERGRTIESVILQYLATVRPMHEEFVEPSKKWADMIIPEGGFNEGGLAMLYKKISEDMK